MTDPKLPITAGAAARITALLHTIRRLVVGIIVGFLVLGVAVISGFHRIDAETRARRADACTTQLRTQDRQEQALAELGRRLGARPSTIQLVHDIYDELPTPAACPEEKRP